MNSLKWDYQNKNCWRLTKLVGLSPEFVVGSALDMPFDDRNFDVATLIHVGMNLPDRLAVLRECFRVLKAGATLVWTEVTSAEGEPHYPLPWARDEAGSYVCPIETLLRNFVDANFEVLSVDDETDAHLELAKQMKASGAGPPKGQFQANEVVLGADFGERRANYIRGLADGALASKVIYGKKAGRS